ncbi:hypothetical protein [Dechloromonas hortensis]|uniref:hypothetical protein n=1 Tax=Dechloromonas hortensis TaxID=337779 RepID=UPI001291DD7C|nr:hypothetical protein [Dechloromonas hortensis]
MHPSAALVLWLAGIVAIQFLGYPGLGLMLTVAVLSTPAICRPWLGYARRARWLLLSLWLIVAFNTPGEALQDLSWAPTYEGIAEANLQVVRLLSMLVLLAWLFVRLGRDGLFGGLWGMLLPLRYLGLDTGRLVVRLSLVLENLQTEHEKGAWKKMLVGEARFVDGPDSVRVAMPNWKMADTLLLMIIVLVVLGGLLL